MIYEEPQLQQPIFVEIKSSFSFQSFWNSSERNVDGLFWGRDLDRSR